MMTANIFVQDMDSREALLCARLNLGGAKRLLQKGSLKPGVTALYDSVLFGMHYSIACRPDFAEVDLADAASVFHRLASEAVFEDPHAFNRLSLAVERVLWQGSDCVDINEIVMEAEVMLKRLGVTTFDGYTRSRQKEGDAYS
ncbi:MAG: hypothetical protein ACM3XO_07215 [Bacteroidota bacterium]